MLTSYSDRVEDFVFKSILNIHKEMRHKPRWPIDYLEAAGKLTLFYKFCLLTNCMPICCKDYDINIHDLHISTMVSILIYVAIFQNHILRI